MVTKYKTKLAKSPENKVKEEYTVKSPILVNKNGQRIVYRPWDTVDTNLAKWFENLLIPNK